MANESAVLSNVILVLILAAVIVLGSFWVYRRMGPSPAPAATGPGIQVNLGDGSNAGGY